MELIHARTEYIITDLRSENEAMLIGYLSAVLDNTLKNLRNKKKFQTVLLETADQFISNDIEDYCSFDWQMCENSFLIKAYHKFTEKMKRVFNQFYFSDRSSLEIAVEEGVSQRAINALLKRCKEEIGLQKNLEERQIEKGSYC